MDEHRLLITGDREWDDEHLLFEVLAAYPATMTTVIQGEASGADTLARFVAGRLGMTVKSYPAYWDCEAFEADTGETCKHPDGRHEAMHGRPAGVLRNGRMLNESNPTEVLAFHDDLAKSKGTRDMVKKAAKAGLKVTHYSHDNPQGVVL